MQTKSLSWLLPAMAVLFTVLAIPRATAAVNILLDDAGGNVIAIISGTANTSDLGTPLASTIQTIMVADSGFLVAGGTAAGGFQFPVDRYSTTLSGSSYAFGTADLFAPGDINTGDIAGVRVAVNNLIPSYIFLPRDYVSGTALSGTTTWTGTSFATFGLTPGQSFTWTWGMGADTDSITIQTVPEPSTFALFGMSTLGLVCAIRQQRRRRSV